MAKNARIVDGQNGRDARGRFVNCPGPGRRPGPRAEFARAVQSALDGASVEKIVRAIAKKAEGGDLRAAELLLRLALGRSAFENGTLLDPIPGVTGWPDFE